MGQKWPDYLWIVRHGESAGNVARDAAELAGLDSIDVPMRDVDVPLSPLGERQATALGRWFGSMPAGDRPTVVIASPYVRARQTCETLLEASGLEREGVHLLFDERLREREFGIFDRLTRDGAHEKYPDLADMREALGKFYFRPPGGESWCDVIMRLRSFVNTMSRDHRRERVLVVGHLVVVLCFRYLLENLTEETVLQIDRSREVANCSVTGYAYDPTLARDGRLALRMFNFVTPLEEAGEIVTTRPDSPVGPK
jgi:broad specificity phosphatase PhoE